MAETTTTISNMALAAFGAKTLDDFDTDTSNEAIKSRLFYSQTREALLRSYDWPFAVTRISLAEHTDSPAFEWDNKFKLPDDYSRLTNDYTVTDANVVPDRWTIEGRFVLTNETEVDLVYVRDVTDIAEFDALFIEMLVLTMGIKLIFPIAGTSALTAGMRKEFKKELFDLSAKAKMVAFKEVNVTGRKDWSQARFGTGIPQ